MGEGLLLERAQEEGIEQAIKTLVDIVLAQAPEAEILALLGLLATTVGRLAQQQGYGGVPPPTMMQENVALQQRRMVHE